MRDEAGVLIGFTKVARDVTDRRKMEEELRAAKEEAEQANRAKDQFLAVLSHELLTPLNPILLAVSSMLELPAPPEEFRPTLVMIRQNVNLQARLIDDILDVMRIVRGKMPLHWGIADAHALIRNSFEISRSDALGKRLHVGLDLAAGDHCVNADAAKLQQVFWNLIKNVVKFTPEGGSVVVRTRNEGKSLVIEVADTGIGIEPDALPRIFDAFQLGETTITRKFGGLELRLAIGKGVIDAHGGLIAAESPGKGRGTAFRVVLDTVPPLDGGGCRPAEEGDTRSVMHPAVPLRVLAVEDELAALRLMARLLRGLDHEVTTAGTVADAGRRSTAAAST